MANFDPCNGEENLFSAFTKVRALAGNPRPSEIRFVNNYTDTDNLQIKVCEDGGQWSYKCHSIGGTATENDGGHNCYVRIPVALCGYGTHYSTTDTQYMYLLLNNGINPTVRLNYTRQADNKSYEHYNGWALSYGMNYYSNNTEAYNDNWYNDFVSKYKAETLYKSVLDTVKQSINGMRISYINVGSTSSTPQITNMGTFLSCVGKAWCVDKLPFPVFDLFKDEERTVSNATDIIKYLQTGDDSGAIDPFDPNNPKAQHITDWKTNVQLFISPEESDKKKTHLTIVAYNNDLINNYDTIEDNVRLHTVVLGATAGGQAFFAPMNKYPTQNLIVSDFPTNRDIDIYSGLYMDNPFNTSWYFGVHLKKKDNSSVHCTVDFVTHSETYPHSTMQVGIQKTQIVDGYRYTDTTTGEWVEVIYRAITLDDLNGYKYKNPEDNENSQSGTDGTFTTGGGLRTYSITNDMFNTINNSLWSTDWTSVFKSTTVNPISCVIACKAIPFTAPTSGTDTVMIANMNSGVTASYVTPVKSFAVGSVNIPAYAGDFTDITLTHIRCYLPYIGWVELPASECIERVAYPSVGIEARHKHLSFKYIVDFVDGAVRCVVSVNGTERWYFDGNCSIDVPVTSDNHTQAVSNAIRSGVQTGLSIVTAVAGAYAGNAGAVAGGVMGAMQSAPNIFPTYSFTATSNGSGYINASMNQHIMLVIEHPNVIRSADYARRVGVPCGLSLNLGSLNGYTRCVDVNVTGIDATPNEIQRIKSLLESGVYL